MFFTPITGILTTTKGSFLLLEVRSTHLDPNASMLHIFKREIRFQHSNEHFINSALWGSKLAAVALLKSRYAA